MNIETLQNLAGDAARSKDFYPDPRFPPSLYYKFFEMLTEKMGPNLSVELGTCGGGGGLHMAKGYPEGKVISVDYSWDHPENIKHIQENFPNYKFMLSDSIIIAKYIYDVYGPIDILFMDTVHTYERTMNEFNTYRPYLSGNAVVCMDDLFRPGVEEAWNEMPEPKVRLDDLHCGSKFDGETGSGGDGGFGGIIITDETVWEWSKK